MMFRFVTLSARVLVLVHVGLGGVLTGCGGSPPAPISAPTASILHGDVRLIRVAAGRGNVAGAQAGLTSLRTDIARLTARRELASADAAVLLVDANQIAAQLGAGQPQPTAPSTGGPLPSQPAVGSGEATGQGKARTDGNGKGRGKGDGTGHGKGNGGGGKGGGGGGGDGGGD